MNTRSARHASEFIRICDYDASGKVRTAMCPGHECKVYQVSLDRTDMAIRSHCLDVDEGEKCKGNKHGVCYHTLAVIIHAAWKSGAKVAFCDNEQGAKTRATLGGQIIKVMSLDSPDRISIFAIVERNQTP